MEQTTILKRSPKGLQVQVITLGVAALLLALFGTWASAKLFGWAPNQGFGLKVFIWIVLLAGWGITSIKLWFDWNVKRYEIAKDALIIHAKAGNWGTSKSIYRYESIISLKMTQGVMGKRFGYGDVHISIPKIEHDVVMNDIDHPVDQLSELQNRIRERSIGSDTLIT